jgi:hypothetical protein
MMAVITMITLMTAGIPDTFTHNTHTKVEFMRLHMKIQKLKKRKSFNSWQN